MVYIKKDDHMSNHLYFILQGKKNFGTCQRIHSLEEQEYGHMTAENVVFAFQMPLPKNNMHLTFSRWQQSLIGVLSLDIEYEEEVTNYHKNLYESNSYLSR